MLRILHVVDSLHLGGTEWQCVSLTSHLDPTRFRSHLVSLTDGGPLIDTLRDAGVPSRTIAFRGLRRAAGLRDIVRLAFLMRRDRIHVVQAYGFYSNVPAVLAARIARVPILLVSRRDMGEYLTITQRRIERAIFSLVDRVLVNAESIRNELITTRQASANKILLIRNGVDLRRFNANGSPASASDIPEWAGRGKVVAMVAMFRTAKDHVSFLKAARRLLAADSTLAFVVAGGVFPGSAICESLRESAVQLVQELGISRSVRFLGPVNPGQLPELLRHVDVTVLASSKYEGTPNVVLEYMAAGKPVVATDAGGCREVVLDGITGFLVPPKDPDQLADRILRLLRNEEQATRMGRAGRVRVEAEFSLTRMIHRTSSLYESLARQKLGIAQSVAT